MRRIPVIVFAFLIPCIAAAQDPNLQRGFHPTRMYDLLGLDSVSMLNGNLNVRIPIGQSYAAGPTLKYQFMLAYNSKVWEYEYVDSGAPPGMDKLAVPEKRSNAGFGWVFTFGQLLPPKKASVWLPWTGWTYVAPDGGEHVCNATTDVAESYCGGEPYRLRRYPADTTQTAQYREIDMPDGTIHRFDPDGMLTEMRDRRGNWVKVTRTASEWRIKDGYGADTVREHVVTLAEVLNSEGQPYTQTNFQVLPTRITLATFGGSTAQYDLTYQHVKQAVGGCRFSNPSATFFLPLLTKIDLPDGTKFEASYLPSEEGICTSGALSHLTLPTRGRIAWTYGMYELPNQSCVDIDPEASSGQSGWRSYYGGVVQRALRDRNGNLIEKRDYTPSLLIRETISQICGTHTYNIEKPPEKFSNTVTVSVPDGASERQVEKTRYHFSVFPSGADETYTTFASINEYGFPLTRDVTAGPSNAPRFLSSQTYVCSNGTCSSTKARTRYLRYEANGGKHIEAERTVFHDDSCGTSGSCYTDVARSDLAGLPGYRRSVHTSNIPDTPDRTTYTNFTPDIANWLLNLYSVSWVQLGNGPTASVTKVVPVFDANTGEMKSLRKYKNVASDAASITTSTTDLLSAWCRDSATTAGARGFVTSERHFGGDSGSIPTGDPCTAARTEGNFFLNHQYTFTGAVLTTHTAQYSGTSHFVTDEDFDAKTGFVKKTRDTAGIETELTYDTSGRVTAIKPHGRVETHYDYSVTLNPAKVAVWQQCPTGTGASPCVDANLTKSVHYYDDLGRLTQERRQFSSTEWTATWTTYGPLGQRKQVTVPVSQTSENAGAPPPNVPVTSWTYDHLGRTTLETRPDNSTTSTVYVGNRQIERYVGGEKRTTETYDGLGQLVEVRQRPSPNESEVVTSYRYDVGGRLTSVRMVAPNGAAQERTFDYDGRGFLRWESQPESGMASFTYDALGHVTAKNQSAANTQFDLRYTYDAAERLASLSGRNPLYGTAGEPEFRTLKEFEFATANTSDDFRKGKLVRAARYNYSAGLHAYTDTYKIEDSYKYLDLSGRRSHKTTTIFRMYAPGQFDELKKVYMGVAYNALDQPQSIQYPTCIDCGMPNTAPDRSGMTYSYERGRLKSIAGFVSNATYGPNGVRELLMHTNGRTDSQESDAMSRLSRLSFIPTGERCVRPSFVSQPASTSVTSSGASVTLSAVVSGTSPFEYQWVNADGVIVGTNQSITVTVNANTSYYVVVKNACGFEQSQTAKVTIGPCEPPSTGTIRAIRQVNGSYLLKPDPIAQQQRWYVWHRTSDGHQEGTGETLIVPAPSTTMTYSLTIIDGCGTATSEITLTAPPIITQTGLVATVQSETSVHVSWPPVPGGATYVVERKSGAAWEWLGQTDTPAFTDNTVVAGYTYAYRIYAMRFGVKSDYSNSDVATTKTFTRAVAGQPVTDLPVEEMLKAVNSVRAAVGWNPVTWPAILAAADPVPDPGKGIMVRHITSARMRMNEALQALGVPVGNYTDPVLAGRTLRALHINEVQQRAD